MRNTQLPAADREWTEDDARKALDAWRRSGTSIAVFARECGLSAPRLYWWRRRLPQAPSSVALVPATIVSTAAIATAAVVRLPNGVAVEVANAEVSPAWIAELIDQLMRWPA